ncbi:ATP-binding protein [Rhizobium tubonense]|uniref:Chromosome segregation protein SMC n=1 Tax=Rhizobium tubonense TaxID=484088 RepID=A0A2W4F7K8_9HYPH|nr:YhaN family protein [Rhizobium tubonense]PZM16850.1 chromosome segregation protein SMC [Rhizobium tubonense]
MRFNRLDIIRYGALTDRALDFRADARLHVIYGPNEAGKSSALSAISDLLFGFPRGSARFNFLHDAATLRIGATISARDGSKLDFRRRRGNKNTLLGTDEKEAALPEDALSPFIGNLGRDVFERAFGLDSDRLRLGAAAMLQSGGEIGSLLFSAASGLTGLSRLRLSLDGEADSIYAQRRSKDRSFYQALDRHDEARKAERENELKSGDWKKLVSEAAGVESELAALQAERQQTKTALDHLKMLKKLDPMLREIDIEQAALLDFADLHALPPGFEQHLSEALDIRSASETALRTAEDDIARLADELATSELDSAVLDSAGAIMGRYAEKGAYLKAREDISRVNGEVEDFDIKLTQLARKLGLEVDGDGLERRQPAEADLVRLRVLATEGRELTRSYADIRRRLQEERNRLAKLEGVDRSGRLIDPKPYLDQMAALQPDLADLQRLDKLQVSAEREEAVLAEAVARLQPDVVDLDRLLSTALPDIAILTEERRRIDELRTAALDAAARLAAQEAEKAELESSRAALEGGGTIVTREDIAAARADRDVLWQTYAKTPEPAAVAPFERSIAEADRLADLALADAERVSRHAQITARLAALDPMIVAAQRRRDTADAALSAANAEFHALFAAVGIVPLAPERMIEWRRAVDGLIKQRQVVHGLQDELATLRLAGDRLAPALAALAEATGLSGGESLPPRALGRALFAHVSDLGQRWTDSRSAEGERLSIIEAISRHEERETALKAEAEDWQNLFADAAGRIGLSEGATVDMVEAALDLWKEVPPALAERENRRRRVRGMLRDISAFEEAVRAVVRDVAPELSSYSADAAMDVLRDKAIAANADQQHRTGLLKAVEAAEHRLARCRQAAATAEAALAALAAVVPDADDLTLLLARLREHRDLLGRLAASRRRFQEQAEGQPEDVVRAGLVDFVRVEADLEIERLEALDATQLRRFGTLSAQLAENDRQRKALESGVSAEYAVFEKLSAEQEAKDLARQWVVLKLAAHMLNASMESYREQQADPVMTRAGELFSLLTGNRFARLVQDYGGDDELQLLAERTGGERVPLDGLSEGTGDQLYLALRLAFLEDYSARNEPPPLVVDDIFQTFDDDRTASGLRALAGTADRFQTILFTHETSVVEIAKQEIGAGLDLIRL